MVLPIVLEVDDDVVRPIVLEVDDDVVFAAVLQLELTSNSQPVLPPLSAFVPS